jgi:uncharacterized protein (TIGR04255 family)
MSLPINISPCPILDALVEVRFSSKINANAVFGLIYNVLQKDFEKVESLPILQLPDVVRTSDPNFRYKPHYRILNSDFVIQIGPDVLSISSFPKYVGWNLFSETIFNVLLMIEKIGIINKIERIGIRYVNFFENNIFDKINLDVCIGSAKILYKNTVVRTEIEQGEYGSTLQIANNAINNGILGSIIDIDTFTISNLQTFFDRKTEIINNGHTKEKELFYSLLKPDFLNTLNPKY